MILLQQIDEDLKTALKEKNEVATSALRNLKAAVKNSEIAARNSSERASLTEGEREKALTNDDVLNAIAKKVKQHKDSIESFQSGGRADLVEHESAQMQVLQKYLPAQMDEEALAAIVNKVIADSNAGPSDFGKVMKEVVAKIKGQADGKEISRIVKEQLK